MGKRAMGHLEKELHQIVFSFHASPFHLSAINFHLIFQKKEQEKFEK